ncbi:cobalt-precorrin-7 (C5)-methyltransferase [Methanomicrobium sp. W14]|uniref:cobalt-precorrin-7 (C(5))-methyltransferase n=1 Tax=Methanomicrobium sp. W14 TaxID=2817839 RepID=UPI001AE1B6C5|nr:cobalt-precorrin-7 (C(5))-methyltransferase [Methanomicrobium sp. W14]MBP2132757.1 cobalt-precorrin-7 (C5)-methyltransferase [Methanomicrobium sp. W14]
MKIIGAGCGPGLLTEEAIENIRNANLIYGSGRAIDICRKYIGPKCEVHEITDYKGLKTLPENAVVLSTGDPMLAGLGYLKGEIVTGISSMQYAFAKLRISLTKAVVVNAHGKDHEEAMKNAEEEIERGHIVFLIADPDFDTKRLCKKFTESGKDGIKVSVCEDLGYENERISTGSAESPPEPKSSLYVLIAGRY